MESNRLEMLKQIADALAAQFGPNCEVVIHDLSAQNAEHPIVYIVNGHVRDLLLYNADVFLVGDHPHVRSEERRVGKESRSRWSPYP